jgi:hypothetical protein
MKENHMILKEFTNNQSKFFIDTIQLYDAYRVAFEKNRSYRGGMHWKKSKNREYLFRTKDRYGNGKSLGPRSVKTEGILREFQKNKKQVTENFSNLKNRLKEQSRFCKAAKIHRVPRVVTTILRLLEQQNILGPNLMVVGTNALYAYEAAAGVFLDQEIMATADMDILWDNRPRLTLIQNEKSQDTDFLDILRKADRSFEMMGEKSFRAVNKDGYMIDLLKPVPSMVFVNERKQIGGKDDLEAVEVMNLQWLLSSPKFSQIVIGDDGFPALIVVPDPRAFSLHKLWLSKKDDRDPLKRRRDKYQGIAAARLVLNYLTQYKFKQPELRMFPADIVEEAAASIENIDTPPGFE